MNSNKITLFVPGRLCLFGEHSDWAGIYRTINASIVPGEAIVTGIEQGIYAEVEKSNSFEVTSRLPFFNGRSLSCRMDNTELDRIAKSGEFFSYVAGTAEYINTNYVVGGLHIHVTKMDLPIKSGLSSSAAICVLVARAFNRLYGLQMNTKGEMFAAFKGEQKTPSRCGRLDQACAYGVNPVHMLFDGDEIDVAELKVSKTMHFVVANLMASKDTIKILADLNKCYPFAENEKEESVQEALGADNHVIVSKAIEYLENGNLPELGNLMTEWQKNFDKKVMPACSELNAPVLHKVLNDLKIKEFIYGGKGVGSQGDGSVQFLAKDENSALRLQEYLESTYHMPSFTLTLHPGKEIKKAIIPLAGFGTRVFPATKCLKKCFLPIIDSNGVLKPALLIMLEQLIDAGIEDICLVIGEDDQKEFDNFFGRMSSDNYDKLPDDKKQYQKELLNIADHITYVHQTERLGFGHAVSLCREFAGKDPVLLTLGDFLYKTNNDASCITQLCDAFKERGKTTIGINEVELERVQHYGIITGSWENADERVMRVSKMTEKPSALLAEEHLSVKDSDGRKKYYATFGLYILTEDVFNELDDIISSNLKSQGEFQLTDALERVCEKYGMDAYRVDGESFDIGIPEEYYKTFVKFGQ